MLALGDEAAARSIPAGDDRVDALYNQVFRELLLPHYRRVADQIALPWNYGDVRGFDAIVTAIRVAFSGFF